MGYTTFHGKLSWVWDLDDFVDLQPSEPYESGQVKVASSILRLGVAKGENE